MKRVLAPLLCVHLLLAGCAGWNVAIQGSPVRPSVYASMDSPQGQPLSAEEKAGVLLILGVAIAGTIAVGIAASQ